MFPMSANADESAAFLTVAATFQPFWANNTAVSFPIPLDVPVIKIVLILLPVYNYFKNAKVGKVNLRIA